MARAFVRQKAWEDGDQVVALLGVGPDWLRAKYTSAPEGLKAAVPGLEIADVGTLPVAFQNEIVETSILGRLPGIRRTEPHLRLLTPATPRTLSLVAQSKGIPVLSTSFGAQSIEPVKYAGIVVCSNESLEADGLEELLQADLLSAAGNITSLAFVAGIASGVTPIASNITSLATLDEALADAMTAQEGPLRTSSWVMSSQLAGDLALVRGTSGAPAYPGIGARGGELAGLPVVTYDDPLNAPSDGVDILLVDGPMIAYAAGAAELMTSTEATIEMATNPSGATDTPAAMSTFTTSVFQAEATAIKVVQRLGWARRRDGAVQVIADVKL